MAAFRGKNPLQSGRAARISDVAADVGVSTATVSRTLTFPDRVRPDTRARVLEAVRRLGYTPNEAARTLRAGASRMVLVIIAQRYSAAYFAGVLSGIDAKLSANGYTMIMGSLDDNEHKAQRLVDLVFARQLDGVIVVTGSIPRIGGRSILDAGVPIVTICAEIKGKKLPTVLINDEECAMAQTRHLTDLGHRRLMYVAGIENNYNEVHRYRGFLKAVEAAGVRMADVTRHPGDYSLTGGVAAAKSFLAMSRRPTGIVCCSDEMAIGFIKTVTTAGISCPSDVSVVGFDGIEFSEFCEPALTTIRQPRLELGAAGAQALLSALRGDKQSSKRHVVLPGQLIVRGSTGPAPTRLSHSRTAAE